MMSQYYIGVLNNVVQVFELIYVNMARTLSHFKNSYVKVLNNIIIIARTG